MKKNKSTMKQNCKILITPLANAVEGLAVVSVLMCLKIVLGMCEPTSAMAVASLAFFDTYVIDFAIRMIARIHKCIYENKMTYYLGLILFSLDLIAGIIGWLVVIVLIGWI